MRLGLPDAAPRILNPSRVQRLHNVCAEGYPMNKILSTAEDYKTRVQREAQARYLSAEYHRHQDIVIGTYTEIVAAVVGTSISFQ